MSNPVDPAADTDEAMRIRTTGREAKAAGHPVTSCPYESGTQANYQWTSGWMQPHPTAPEDDNE
jgi:ribosome modulation factor